MSKKRPNPKIDSSGRVVRPKHERTGWGVLGRSRGNEDGGYQHGGYVPSEGIVRFLQHSNMPDSTRNLGMFLAYVSQCSFRGDKATVERMGDGDWVWWQICDFMGRTGLVDAGCKPSDLILSSFTENQAVEAMRYAPGSRGIVIGKARGRSESFYERAKAQGWLYRIAKGVLLDSKAGHGHASLYVLSPIVWDVRGEDGVLHTMAFTPDDERTVWDTVEERDALYGMLRDLDAEAARALRRATGL